MKRLSVICLATLAQLAVSVPAHAAILYVDVKSTNPTAPYSSWSTAATNIQDAVDAALAGDEVMVTNGVYRTGGKAVFFINSRVATDKPLTVHSVNGAQFTMIEGDFGTRCALLQNGAFLAGFTLTNGNLGSMSGGGGGGVFFGDAPSDAVVSNCVIIGCTAVAGGGAASASPPGSPPGSGGGTLVNCTFVNNGATGLPGGADPLAYGGAVYRCKLVNCTLTNNTITLDSPWGGYGGGAYQSLLLNCLLVGNSCSIPWAAGSGGGAALSSLVNCTVVRNTGGVGGGVYACSVTNSIVYNNSGDNHASDNFVAYSCTTPMPTNGIGNITNAPLFVDTNSWTNLRLQANSPCINAGKNDYVTTPVDVEGNERIVGGTVDMGAYEWVAMPTHYVLLTSPNPTPPYLSWSTAATNIQDAVDAALPGSLVLVTNGVYQTGFRSVGFESARVVVDKPIVVRSINGPQTTVIDGAGDFIRCALLTNGVTLAGFTLTNGFSDYPGGGVAFSGYPSDAVVSNCVITRCVAEFGGAAGSASSATVYPPIGGTLVNCTIRSNTATGNAYPYSDAGGGVDSCRLINCTLIGNNASGPSLSQGGGANASILQNCLLIGNRTGAGSSGGGAANSALINCTVVGNSANSGAGTYACWLTNCIVVANSTNNHEADNFVAYTCTTPFAAGPGNITNAPLFVDTNGWINLRLQTNSPCINAGNNAYATGSTDAEGSPRIVGGTVDIGAYEFQSPSSVLSYAWAQQYGLPTDGSADFADADNDGLNNWQEWIAGTSPTDSSSALRLLQPVKDVSGVTLTWQSVTNRTYLLERTTSIGAPSFSPIADNIVGQDGMTSYVDTNNFGSSTFFYRVRVQ